MRAWILAIDDFDGAAMGIHELEHHGQADSGALDLHARGRPAGVESLENPRAFFGGKADPATDNLL